MENETLGILVIEDNENHLVDAMVEVQRRINSGENIKVHVAKDLIGYFDLTNNGRYEGIISDIFFPTSQENPWDNLANNLVWQIMGKDYCERYSENYRCGDERREKMFKAVRDDWMDGKHFPPTGVVIVDESIKKGTPIVLCTDTYHHGIQTQPVYQYAGQKGIKIVDSTEAREGHSTNKNWQQAFDELFGIIKKDN